MDSITCVEGSGMTYPCGGSTIVRFAHFELIFVPWAGITLTVYKDGSTSLVGVSVDDRGKLLGNEDDSKHAARICARSEPITPEEHRFLHEFLHHAIAVACGEMHGSPITRRAAQRLLPEEQPEPESTNEERAVNAVLHTAFGTWGDIAPLLSLKRSGVCTETLHRAVHTLLHSSRHNEHGKVIEAKELLSP